MAAIAFWPLEIRVKRPEKRIEIDWDDGRRDVIAAELLRVESPSAEVQGHGPDTKQIVAGKRAVGINAVEAVGNYAIRIHFDDGHDTGIFSWEVLRRLGADQAQLFATYLAALDAKGLSRDR
ncbi:DUF971 domain-containing protein [Oleomonas cavernae]|uniref:DUF971 domain-containing protein n=1 Tax=Oleomonas cavernae TaxID=2320859 RepID=A0A418WFB1_9PROT|nr:DUF971 domain-containing protein [Oleomonas cavernae]RJF88715.1 DUF971 domain-containing protein [Oleomonas cavernae]